MGIAKMLAGGLAALDFLGHRNAGRPHHDQEREHRWPVAALPTRERRRRRWWRNGYPAVEESIAHGLALSHSRPSSRLARRKTPTPTNPVAQITSSRCANCVWRCGDAMAKCAARLAS